ncbi:hypothetical protein K402DRAFT_402266 [Aulographum hederae CBS 113979]|uniref:Uncharacterized protein n=1 Tax=Aulographum hederae CBS 113979 TaxID=1176131 RepID=A0A6G1H7D8_9PEZI|nr:hypothetical protein K402DRAFT_402266 [Aulographum hederae CBS 113979]
MGYAFWKLAVINAEVFGNVIHHFSRKFRQVHSESVDIRLRALECFPFQRLGELGMPFFICDDKLFCQANNNHQSSQQASPTKGCEVNKGQCERTRVNDVKRNIGYCAMTKKLAVVVTIVYENKSLTHCTIEPYTVYQHKCRSRSVVGFRGGTCAGYAKI